MMLRWFWLVLPCLFACEDKPDVLSWKTQLPGASVSTPLVTLDFIALGTDKGVVILNRGGTLRCTFESAGQVIAAPKTDGRSIFFGSTNYMAYAISSQCEERWSISTGDRIKSDPLVHKGVVYFSSYDGTVYARNAKSGEAIWIFPERITMESDSDSFEEAAEEEEEFDSLPPVEVKKRDRRKNRKVPPPRVGAFSYSSPTIWENLLFIGNLDNRLYALDIRTGDMEWRFRTDAPVTSSPREYEGNIYFGSNDGNVYGIDIRNRKRLWKSKTQYWVNSSAAIEEDILYIGSNDKNLYALNRKTGHALWSFRARGSVVAAPLIYKDLVITAGSTDDGQVYAVHKSTGKLAWQYLTEGKVDSDPVIEGEDLFVSSADGYLYAFDIKRIYGLTRETP